MKRLLSLILALSMVFALCGCGKSANAEKADELINAIGEVTLESKTAIDEAWQFYSGLSDKEKEEVENYTILENAIAEYADKLINAIGEVTLESKTAIDEAWQFYSGLSDKEKEEVENYTILENAIAEYTEIEDAYQKDLILTELTEEKWINVNDGDAYLLNKDGTGTHDGTKLSFSLDDNQLTVVEGTASVQDKVFVWDRNNDYPRLIPEGENVFYVKECDFEEVGSLVREENISILLSPKWWWAKAGSETVRITFKEDGIGYWVFSDSTMIKMEWRMEDNNTIHASMTYAGQKGAIIADIVNDNGDYRLEDINGTVWFPRQ